VTSSRSSHRRVKREIAETAVTISTAQCHDSTDAIPVGKVELGASVVDPTGLSGIAIHNPRRRLLVSCRSVERAGRQLLYQVNSYIITKGEMDPSDIFTTSRDNKPENKNCTQWMRNLPVSLCTVHGAKSEEWDSVMHVDLGETNGFFTNEDDEEQRILYVSHTRAIDELWHVATCRNMSSLSRFFTRDVASHFSTDLEAWEAGGPDVRSPIFFEPGEKEDLPSSCFKLISITDFAKASNNVWQQPTDERPSVQDVVWRQAPEIRHLPEHLWRLNAANGIFMEWLCLWHMHESATRESILTFLAKILRTYSVNRAFAGAMQFVFDNGSPTEMRLIRQEFERLLLSIDEVPPVDGLYTLLSRAHCRLQPSASVTLRSWDVEQGMRSVGMQQRVHLEESHLRCPVRPTIPHFDSYAGPDSWKLTDVAGLKKRVLDACRTVLEHRSQARTEDKFICLLFMRSVQMLDTSDTTRCDEQAWSTLVTTLQDATMLQDYVQYINDQMPAMHADMSRLRGDIDMTSYQTTCSVDIDVCHVEGDVKLSYVARGFADASSVDGVLEVTSRQGMYREKVQQSHLYASILGKRYIYNYYIENRLLVRRALTEDADDFLRRSGEELVLKRGLPVSGSTRHTIGRACLFSEWSVRPKRVKTENE
jgi:hypothetical protein